MLCRIMISPLRVHRGVVAINVNDLLAQRAGGALAIDVAITSALSKSAMRFESPCEEYAETQKHGKYDKSFAETNFSFCAMVWETLGALNSEGEEVLRQIF